MLSKREWKRATERERYDDLAEHMRWLRDAGDYHMKAMRELLSRQLYT